ncbi:MAG: acyl-CoA thioesterase [Tenacibaculum sp.]
MSKNTTTIRIRYADTDQMGVVYHGNYAQFFEVGRTEWLRSLDTSYKCLENNNIILPVIELNCKFKKPAYYDDLITITTCLKAIPIFRLEFYYEITNQYNELLCNANTVLVFVNKLNMKPTRCPKYILEKIKKTTTPK